MRPLSDVEIENKLQEVPTWMYTKEKIRKQFVFKTFSEAAKFLNKLAPFCDKLDHHPSVKLIYNKIIFSINTLSIDGKITERDFAVAKEIERLYSKMK